MQSNSRQILSFVAILMMVVSAFAFIPSAKGEASLTTTLQGFYNEYSFASVNGTAEYDITLVNDGDVDFDTVSLTASFQDYCMPRADDFPQMEIVNQSIPTKTNPLGVKGAGETGTVGAPPAVVGAICDALDVIDIAMPATPEKVWRALNSKVD